MFNFFHKSLRNKLIVSFFVIGFVPFVIMIAYTVFFSETKLVNKVIAEQLTKADVVIHLINTHINSIKKEINFIGSLDIMDDIISDDIDKRISIILTKKVDDFNLDVEMFVINEKFNIIASSNKEKLFQSFEDIKLLQHSNGEYISKSHLYIYSEIYASFDTKKHLGYLILKYNLKNLKNFLTYQDGIYSYIINKKSSLIIGDKISLKLNLSKDEGSLITDKHLIVYKKFLTQLKGFYLVYAVDKDISLKILYDFVKFISYISIVILFLIIYISIRYSKDIVLPIEKLTSVTEKIIKDQDYSTRLSTHSKDELAILTLSFNTMLQTTSHALKRLEEENTLRLKRFTQLIKIFNMIIQTTSQKECIEVSVSEIKKLTNNNDLVFHKEPNKDAIELYVTDFEKNKKFYFGSISLSMQNIEDLNEREFYTSIASMITLQLDRIRLIDRTMAVSKAKSAFISNMSHELRTPLNAIIGFSQFLIAYEELTDDQRETIGSIESSAHYLLNMINEILDITKIEAGKMEARFEYVNLVELIHNCYNMLKPLADDKNLNFELITDKFTIKKFKTDPKMFQQIVVNLISNAIKFTEKGSITLELLHSNTHIFVKITDSGIGISKKDMAKLFNDFTQVENIMQKKHKGTGLGLSLSKKMANILGGDVDLSSDGLGNGSVAVFSLEIQI